MSVRPRSFWPFLLLLLCFTLMTVVGCRSGDQPGGDGGAAPPALTTEQLQQAITAHNRGIAFIENKQWAEADQALLQVATLLPNDPVATGNLAVSRVLSLIDRKSPYNETTDLAAWQAAITRAQEATIAFRRAAADISAAAESVAALLQGKLAAFEDGPNRPRMEQAIQFFEQAIELSGNRPEMWFALVSALDANREYSESVMLLEKLQQTAELAPDNLHVLSRLLEEQALALTSKDPQRIVAAAGIRETLQRTAQQIAPLNESFIRQSRVNITEIIEKALADQQGDLSAIVAPAMITRNLLTRELVQQIDMRRIDLNLLEYIQTDLISALNLSEAQRRELQVPVIPTVLTAFVSPESSTLPHVSGVSQIETADMNLDGQDDLILLQEGRVVVWQRTADGTAWELMAETPADLPAASGFLLDDFDRDFDRARLADVKAAIRLRTPDGDRRVLPELAGQQRWFDSDLDLVLWSESGASLLLNTADADGKRTFVPAEPSATVTGVRHAVAADLEADGDLDLVFATSSGMTIWKNLDGTTFETAAAEISGPDGPLNSVRAVDWNRDMAMDIIGLREDGRIGWLQNILHFRFRWLDGASVADQIGTPQTLQISEFNRDGRWDLLLGGSAGSGVALPQAPERPESIRAQQLTAAAVSQIRRADLDNDGFQDILEISDGRLLIHRGQPEGTFALGQLSDLLPAPQKCQHVTPADLDQDGDLDLLLVTTEGSLAELINEGGDSNQWIEVVPRAIGEDPQFQSNRVNMHATGAVLEVRAGQSWQGHVIDAPRMHIGLGATKQLDSIRIIWTDGIPQNITQDDLLQSRITVLQPQILIGSCPYIYTWNGERFEFFSDCLWAAPIGLIQANGDFAPTREWEYLHIPGRMLQPDGNRYRLQLTEELWEAAYFDEVRLTAVDHPADVSIFSNEKVGSPQMAAPRIHTVRNRRLPLQAVDGAGRDLLPGLLAQDQDYVQAFHGRIVQGLTDEWTIEFDFGALEPGPDGKLLDPRLVLIGWVFPTDTSINQQLLQNPRLPAPAAPALEVPSDDGTWTTVRPFLGFPSGKTKAMVIELGDVISPQQTRFRIRSSMELYWDAAFLIANEQPAEVREYACELLQGDLHYRGFSERIYSDQSVFRQGRAPESYDYSNVDTQPRWNEMGGRFTRYGETTELLTESDDLLVVMGPGDELTVEFAVPEAEIPKGWVRDFILYNTGWDKDANLGTVYGQSSEPYPVRTMKSYPGDPAAPQNESPKYQRWLRDYQTREYSRHRFHDLLRRRPASPAAE